MESELGFGAEMGLCLFTGTRGLESFVTISALE